ncbi:MAG: MarR family winged helix-turn-helix transcriptional regulator [Christensenellales bacterium]|jgi:DNA-binding MarR family transcriptional regulator
MDLPKAISLLHRKMNAELNYRLNKIGLSNAKLRLMKHLNNKEEMTQADLCRDLELDKSTVAKMLNRMESHGFITKHTKPDDSRFVWLSLTPKSRQIIPKSEIIISEWSKDVTSVLSETEKELFYELLHKISQQAAAMFHKQL